MRIHSLSYYLAVYLNRLRSDPSAKRGNVANGGQCCLTLLPSRSSHGGPDIFEGFLSQVCTQAGQTASTCRQAQRREIGPIALVCAHEVRICEAAGCIRWFTTSHFSESV